MAKGKRLSQGSTSSDERILDLLKGLFIIEGKKAGMSIEDLRVILKVKNNYITNITKRMKSVSKDS